MSLDKTFEKLIDLTNVADTVSEHAIPHNHLVELTPYELPEPLIITVEEQRRAARTRLKTIIRRAQETLNKS